MTATFLQLGDLILGRENQRLRFCSTKEINPLQRRRKEMPPCKHDIQLVLSDKQMNEGWQCSILNEKISELVGG